MALTALKLKIALKLSLVCGKRSQYFIFTLLKARLLCCLKTQDMTGIFFSDNITENPVRKAVKKELNFPAAAKSGQIQFSSAQSPETDFKVKRSMTGKEKKNYCFHSYFVCLCLVLCRQFPIVTFATNGFSSSGKLDFHYVKYSRNAVGK